MTPSLRARWASGPLARPFTLDRTWVGGSDATGTVPCVDVWCAALDVHPACEVDRLVACLADDERERARQMVDRVRRRFIVGRALLRATLARYTERPAATLRFSYGPFGKPDLAPAARIGSRTLHFNVSHSGGTFLVALAAGRRVGVDVEAVRRLDLDGLTGHCLSGPERTALATFPDSARTGVFLAWWTRKEAFVKATGEGLSFPLHEVRIPVRAANPDRALAVGPHGAEPWLARDLAVGDDYRAAVVVEPGAPLRLRLLDVPPLDVVARWPGTERTRA